MGLGVAMASIGTLLLISYYLLFIFYSTVNDTDKIKTRMKLKYMMVMVVIMFF